MKKTVISQEINIITALNYTHSVNDLTACKARGGCLKGRNRLTSGHCWSISLAYIMSGQEDASYFVCVCTCNVFVVIEIRPD